MLGLGAWLVVAGHASPGIMVATTVLLVTVGTFAGLAAATWGGWVDSLVRRACDLILGIPLTVGAILVGYAFYH